MNIREHYAFVFTGIDMLYQGISDDNFRIRIRLCAVYVTETRVASSFIDEHVNQDSLNVDDALSDLTRFIAGNGRSIVGQYDHVMLFTGYDLYSSTTHNVVGYAYLGTMCRNDGYSSSVIEDRNSLSVINTAAHELGHSLSAEHDGSNNLCSFEDRYIMAASNSAEDIYTMYHPWQFSSCSVQYFGDFLKKTADTNRGYTCLGFFLVVNFDIPDVSGRLMGQEVTPDQQCKLIHGTGSNYCRSVDGVSVTDICHAMYCRDPYSSDMCFHESALHGTSCGDGKMCVNGMCLDDPYAPQVNARCIFGDQPGNVYQSMTCSQFVANRTFRCFNDLIYRTCCFSCDQVYNPIIGCEYGDYYTDCQSSSCSQYKTQCCKTCNYGTPFIPTTTTKRTTPIRSTFRPVPWSTKTTTTVTSTKTSNEDHLTECTSKDLDLMPEICTAPSVCQTQRNVCCRYCSRISSATQNDRVVLVHLTLLILIPYYLLA